MDLSRRQFLQLSTSAGAGTAVGTLVGLGVNLTPATTHAQHLRIQDAKVTPSVCPYCSVGCATLVHTIDGTIVNIEGDPRSPHNEGTLCPKGAERAFIVWTARVAFDIDDCAIDRMHERGASHGAVGADTRGHFGVLNAQVLGVRGGWCQVDAKANERADRRAGACTRG